MSAGSGGYLVGIGLTAKAQRSRVRLALLVGARGDQGSGGRCGVFGSGLGVLWLARSRHERLGALGALSILFRCALRYDIENLFRYENANRLSELF